MRSAKELLIASKEFANEIRWLSWWHVWSTLLVLGALLAVSVSELPLVVRLISSVVAGLVAVRIFVIYHDYQHHAILNGSRLARVLMNSLGVVMLNPPTVWNRSHDHHHKNNSKTFGANIGSFPIMTTDAYAKASTSERMAYAVARHPITIALGLFTIFLWAMCLRPFLMSPRRHFDAGLSIAINISLMVVLGVFFGVDVMLLGMFIPLLVAAALGAYLFYAQHNFPSAQLKPRAEWSYVEAALHSSSFISMSPVMHWFTANIGYHHVHHLNARIPFYRLPEAMNALEELQSPGTTSLKPWDIVSCLRLKLWSPEKTRFVTFNGT